ncbi:hypothetical protein [Candidatus Contubernalis alkaliaceticus]|uniref:hypothetical protein n=1 Tax=Candidatus Contubernalis alkaliaceticus TaxID=338645 RepID=UPI001F4C248B|nr:hypothetical protein [Candidatus Contubernalis alkalaceticus]UNC92113.1 hypothetical protein HUE98_08395 [Candidatus Contubernalis alkalaceticus]
MRVKIFGSFFTVKELENKINDFLKQNEDKIEVIDIKMSGTFGSLYATVIYKLI